MYKLIAILSQNDLTRNFATLILVGMIFSYAAISFATLEPEEVECNYYGYHDTGEHTGLCGDYYKRWTQLENYDSTIFDDPRHYITYTMINQVNEHFDVRFLFFGMSILTLFFVYYTTRNVTSLNYPGLLAVFLVIISPIFNKYDTSMTYPMHWVLLWVFSIYFATSKPIISPVIWLISIPTKIINFLFVPVNIFLTLDSDASKKHKKITVGVFIGVIVLLVYLTSSVAAAGFYQYELNLLDFAYWIGMWSIELQNDRISLYLFFVSVPTMFLLSKAKVKYARGLLLSLFAIMLVPAMISGFTKFTNEEYRMLPMVILTCISFSLMIANIDKVLIEFQRFAPAFQISK